MYLRLLLRLFLRHNWLNAAFFRNDVLHHSTRYQGIRRIANRRCRRRLEQWVSLQFAPLCEIINNEDIENQIGYMLLYEQNYNLVNFSFNSNTYISSVGRFKVMLPKVSSWYLAYPRNPRKIYTSVTPDIPLLRTPQIPTKCRGVFILFSKGITTPIASMAKIVILKNCGKFSIEAAKGTEDNGGKSQTR